jgi:hypothetical protein
MDVRTNKEGQSERREDQRNCESRAIRKENTRE